MLFHGESMYGRLISSVRPSGQFVRFSRLLNDPPSPSHASFHLFFLSFFALSRPVPSNPSPTPLLHISIGIMFLDFAFPSVTYPLPQWQEQDLDLHLHLVLSTVISVSQARDPEKETPA